MADSVLLVGCGNMGFALLQGWMRLTPAPSVHVVEPNEGLRSRAADAGAKALAGIGDLPGNYVPDLVILAVKPQMMSMVLPDYQRWAGGQTTFLSVAAGIRVGTIEAALPGLTPIVRCMPNTPASVGAGVLAIFSNAHVDETQAAFAKTLLAAGGMVVEIAREEMMDAITAISGSGPAYVFLFIEALAAAAVKIGLPESLAGPIALQTIYGAAKLAAESSEPAAVLRRNVTSPGGTTAAALNVLMQDDALSSLVSNGATAAWLRAVELGT